MQLLQQLEVFAVAGCTNTKGPGCLWKPIVAPAPHMYLHVPWCLPAAQVYGAQLTERLKQMLGCGIPVTINSDDPAYFGPAYLNANYEFIAQVGLLGPDDLAHLAKNSFTASFIPDAAKQAAHQQVDDALQAWRAAQQQQQQVS